MFILNELEMDTQAIFQFGKVLFLKQVLIQFNVSTIKLKS